MNRWRITAIHVLTKCMSIMYVEMLPKPVGKTSLTVKHFSMSLGHLFNQQCDTIPLINKRLHLPNLYQQYMFECFGSVLKICNHDLFFQGHLIM